MKNLLVRLLLTFLFLAPIPALAQSGSLVVTTCGTLPLAYAPGATRPPTVDVNGNTCSSGGAPATQNVNLTQILGAAPSLTNPLWVFPATGATFPVSGTFFQATQPVSIATAPALVASEAHIGEVGGNIIPITNAMTTSNATVTTGQSIGGIQTLANAVRVSGSLGASGTSGIIQSVVLTFLDAVGSGPLDVYFYNATVTTGSNCQNATAFVLQTADRTNVLGIAHVTDFTSSNTAVVFQANNLAIPFGLASATSLFACVVARGSFAITGTSNASLKVNVLRN